MVHLTKAVIVTVISILPVCSVPIQIAHDTVELMGRQLIKRNLKERFRNGVHAATTAAMFMGGNLGMAGAVLGTLGVRDLESALYTRAIQDELNSRGYNLQLELREVEGLEARNNIPTLVAREFVDSLEKEARRELSDDLKARQVSASSIDELE